MTGKYANWNPAVTYRLGDYGYIDKDSGEFNVQGNIFSGEIAERHSDILSSLQDPIEHSPDDFRVITSAGVGEHTQDLNA
jgi:hypothetical protein